MRYRRIEYRYTVLLQGQPRPLAGGHGLGGGYRPALADRHWSPPTDIVEAPAGLTVTVELAGVELDDLEILLFEDALVVSGQRRLPPPSHGRYHTAEIRQGPFRVVAPLTFPIAAGSVSASLDLGLLRIELGRQTTGGGHGDGG